MLSSLALAGGVLVKGEHSFVFPSYPVKTYYKNRLIWGDTYKDHNKSQSIVGTAVVVWSDKDSWKFLTTTDDNGVFVIEVKPNSPFKIKASDGNIWASYNKELPGIPVGTIKDDTKGRK